MADIPMYTVLRLVKKGAIKYGQIFVVHHDTARGDGDPNDEYFVVTSSWNIPTSTVLLMRDFRKKVADKQPWMIDLVVNEFSRAPKITDPKRLKYLFERYGKAASQKVVATTPLTIKPTNEVTREPFVEAP